jgi:NAD(P)-dependent dehydrogenase (short-subunit alcohol dehydrogenase family)
MAGHGRLIGDDVLTTSGSETVVITGTMASVGRGTTQAFAKGGARLGLLARGANRLDATAAEVRAAVGQNGPSPITKGSQWPQWATRTRTGHQSGIAYGVALFLSAVATVVDIEILELVTAAP